MSLLRPLRQAASVSRAISAQAPSGYRWSSSDSSAAKPPATETSESSNAVHEVQEKIDDMSGWAISGAPGELMHRAVRIYQPTRNTMQSGSGKTERWRIDFDVLPGGSRWENPLMGYASSADYMQGTRMTFRSSEDAARFAEKQGWDFYIQPPAVKRIPPKNYAENFVYKPHKLRIMRTK